MPKILGNFSQRKVKKIILGQLVLIIAKSSLQEVRLVGHQSDYSLLDILFCGNFLESGVVSFATKSAR